MLRKHRSALLRVAAVASAVAGTAVFAAPAMAISSGQPVTGTALSELSLTAGTPAAFTTFQPGVSDTGNTAVGALTAIDTNPNWTLTVQDQTGDGHMQATGGSCTGSESELGHSLEVTTSNPLDGTGGSGITEVGRTTVPGHTGSAANVASATSQLLTTASAFVTTYGQTIGSTESLLFGCVYSLTATYTLQ